MAGTTNLYYYNNNWQVVNETDESGVVQKIFIYGNYIDEVLVRMPYKYYIHDHLYSPVAYLLSNGSVLERYEYDAYGSPYMLEPNFAADPEGMGL